MSTAPRGARRQIGARSDRRNVVLVAVQIALHAYLMVVLPALLLPQSGWWALTLVLAAMVPIPMWILVHEAVHGALYRSRAVNDRLGRALGTLCYGAPFQLLRIGHMLHHKNSSYGQFRDDVRDRGDWRWHVRYYGGLFLQPVAPLLLSNLLVLLPLRWVRPLALRLTNPTLLTRVSEPEVFRRMRGEGLVTLAVILFTAYCWREHPTGLAAIYLLRCILISFDDSVYHFKGPSDPLHGYNLRAPRWLAWAFLDFNYHGVHHLNPALRADQLAGAFRAAELEYDGSYFEVAMQQLRPLAPLTLTPQRRGM